MAEEEKFTGPWLARHINLVAITVAVGFGGLMLALDQPLALWLFPAVALALLVWLVGKAWLRHAIAARGEGQATATAETPTSAAHAAGLSPELIDAFPLPLIITGISEIVVGASQSARRLFPALSAGRPISLALRNPDLLDALVAVRADGTARVIVLDESAPGASVMRVHLVAMSAQESRQPTIMCVFEDLTEQRATERMRVDFIANASHELRTPLASLLGFIETLQGPARDDARARERFLAIMREQAARMARLIDDLLSLSRAELRAHQAPVEVIDLRMIVREIMDGLSLSAGERGVALVTDLPDQPMTIRGERDDLLRLVENLVENAIRYGRDGERVEIGITLNTDDERVLSVRDHGPGIAARHIPRLTERFYRADESHSRDNGGTGLGLAIVKHLVVRHRGRLEIESRLGEGATFRVVFPPASGARE